MIKSQIKCYAPPTPKWIPVVRNGRVLFRFDMVRGVVEINHHGDWQTIDLAAEIERHEQRKPEIRETA